MRAPVRFTRRASTATVVIDALRIEAVGAHANCAWLRFGDSDDSFEDVEGTLDETLAKIAAAVEKYELKEFTKAALNGLCASTRSISPRRSLALAYNTLKDLRDAPAEPSINREADS